MIQVQAHAKLPTEFGNFTVYAFAEKENNWMPHLAIVSENIAFSKTINLRIHSECLTGDILSSKKCDCGEQLHLSLRYITKHSGIVIYHRQEGRNIGLINKLKAYNLQEQGLDTAQANLELGLEADGRKYDCIIDMLHQLEVKSINLLTNNPEKMKIFENTDIKLEKRIPLEIPSKSENEAYLKTKKEYFGHFLHL